MPPVFKSVSQEGEEQHLMQITVFLPLLTMYYYYLSTLRAAGQSYRSSLLSWYILNLSWARSITTLSVFRVSRVKAFVNLQSLGPRFSVEIYCLVCLEVCKVERISAMLVVLNHDYIDLLTKLILYVGAFVITLSSGFGTYIFATHSLQSTHGFVVAILAALVPMYISQFFSYTMMSM